MSAAPRVKDAGLAALIALALAFPLIGFETSDAGVGFSTRFSWVAIAAAVVFAGRLLFGLVPRRFHLHQFGVRKTAIPQGKLVKLASAALIVFAVLLPVTPFASRRSIDLGTLALIYVILGWGLNVVVGLAGLLDLGYVAFYAVGAYTFALAAQWYHVSFWEMLPLSGMTAATAGILLGIPVLRLRGDYLAIVTLGFGEIVRIVLNNWTAVTGGPNGIGDIPRPSVFGMPIAAGAPAGVTTFNHFFGIAYDPIQRLIWLYYVALAVALAINWFSLRVRRLPIGRAWEALREDEIACRALGLNPTTTKLSAFAIGAMTGGFAGALFAARAGFISPESFNFQESATVLSIVVLGGMGSQLGVALAAVILATLPEFGREFAQYRMLIFGAAMVAIMIWRPRGIFTIRAPSVRLDRI
ncbi:MAG: high-affinity branched-chain amino acid ABC transporter permease LivM [Alphaproteobacteria bacterium]|nr:high-affinity branched-chain amino acid ABC transporter permease LivM [Alphaproteobacteria bacterium]